MVPRCFRRWVVRGNEEGEEGRGRRRAEEGKVEEELTFWKRPKTKNVLRCAQMICCWLRAGDKIFFAALAEDRDYSVATLRTYRSLRSRKIAYPSLRSEIYCSLRSRRILANTNPSSIQNRDAAEGADFLMVKPSLPYLDIIRDCANLQPDIPVACYQVSGGSVVGLHRCSRDL